MTGGSSPAKQTGSSSGASASLSSSLGNLVERADAVIALNAEPEISAWSLQIERFLYEDLKPTNFYHWPLQSNLAILKFSPTEEQVRVVKEILVSIKNDIDLGRLSPPSTENRDNKLFEIILASLNLYLGIAAAIIGLVIQKIHLILPHTNSAFFSVIFAAISFLLGVGAQSWAIDCLGKKRTLRESVLCQPVLFMLKFQIVSLAISIIALFFYWSKGGRLGV